MWRLYKPHSQGKDTSGCIYIVKFMCYSHSGSQYRPTAKWCRKFLSTSFSAGTF